MTWTLEPGCGNSLFATLLSFSDRQVRLWSCARQAKLHWGLGKFTIKFQSDDNDDILNLNLQPKLSLLT